MQSTEPADARSRGPKPEAPLNQGFREPDLACALSLTLRTVFRQEIGINRSVDLLMLDMCSKPIIAQKLPR